MDASTESWTELKRHEMQQRPGDSRLLAERASMEIDPEKLDESCLRV